MVEGVQFLTNRLGVNVAEIFHLNDFRPAPTINDGGKARIQRRRTRLHLHEPFHEDMVMLRPDPELPCDCQPSA